MAENKKQKFVLAYTRDRQIITQHAWFYGNSKGMEKLLNCKIPFKVPITLYVNKGPIEIWENKKAIKGLKKKIVEINSSNKEFCKQIIDIFNKKLTFFFKPKWKKKFTRDIGELKKVAEEFVKFSPYYVFIWYSLNSGKITSFCKKEIEKWREQDAFFENTGRYIEKSLEKIYPKFKSVYNLITIDELDNLPEIDILKKRKEKWVSIPGVVSELISLKEFEKKNTKYIFEMDNISEFNILKGRVAFPGIVKGKTRILRNRDQIKNVKQKEIIVSPMTIPEFLPAMKKASAFITDEGGILCHAAIVAREMKKPCIVGTRIATKVLKDGDYVEVDANKGVVKKINPENKIPSLIDQINDVKEWLILNGTGVPHILGFGMRQWTKGVYERYPDNVIMNLCGFYYTNKGKNGQCFIIKDDYRSSAKKLFANLSFLNKLFRDFENDEKAFLNFVKKIETKGEKYLYNNFKEFIRLYDAEYISGECVDGMMVYGDEFVKYIKNKYKKYHKEIDILIKPYGMSFKSRNDISLYSIVVRIKKNKKIFKTKNDLLKDNKIKKKVQEHKKKFYWIQNSYRNIEPLSVEYFAEELLDLLSRDIKTLEKEYNQLINYETKHRKYCDKIKRIKIFEKQDYEKLLWLGKIVYLVDRRKEYNIRANYFIGLNLKELCKKHNLPYNNALFLLPWELESIISKRKKISDYPIKERQKKFFHFYDKFGQEILFTGKEAVDLFKKLFPEVDKNITEVTGQIAQKGIVKGKVRVIMNPTGAKLNKGEVLVTGMTRPDFFGLMKKAAAFVTDEGGITCHAAIISRELKKPCIIGTKIATKIFKDGDLIEVDANKGVVRILKKLK